MTATDLALPERRKTGGTKPAPRSVRKTQGRGKGKAVATPAARPRSRAKATALAAAETAVAEQAKPQQWTAQFVYAGADGSVRMSLLTVTADSADAARAIAAAHAPAAEFMVTVMPRSAEQFLGQVRHQALAATEKSRS
jgi:hypothetical protein